jgi:hypothetical protein
MQCTRRGRALADDSCPESLDSLPWSFRSMTYLMG